MYASADPLFVNPYADCLVPPNTSKLTDQASHPYCLATKFIDDKLLWTVGHFDELKQVMIIQNNTYNFGYKVLQGRSFQLQVVLLTDGMDTRPYRLTWPPSTMIFDISPENVFQEATKKLEGDISLPHQKRF